MPRIGPMELVLVLAVLLLLFGSTKLPEIGTAFGKAIKGFKDAVG